ncbi:tribbles [Drosophila rhopaloa]|uniref:CBL-interacting protein kinase 27 n=1 Tax=Drosophila rhopaloa TaxID=1041015 RepID=A0A6P4DX32_DRORH|nr:tribbles [Drosophila rhopaloa]
MDNSSGQNSRTVSAAANKIVTYSSPGSPAVATSSSSSSMSSNQEDTTVLGLFTPKKEFPNAKMLQTIREKLLTPGGTCDLLALGIAAEPTDQQPVKLIKQRYLISAQPSHISAAVAAKTPASYRHLVDLTASNLRCVDIFTGEEFLCRIVNEPLHKVQRAYFQLQQQDEELRRSTIYGHSLIRPVHDIVALSKDRTYILIAPVPQERDSTGGVTGVYENLHTYIRHEKRLCETEARAIFHQICQTVQVCHRNGIILRDLKLKRFYFIDEARTKLQYESLEGSMILDGDDDTLSDKIGCPLYTAPELLCPQPTYKGKPADMWSLGVILYTMLVGQYPFYEKANCNLITVIRHGNVQIPMTLSKSVRWLLLSLLRKDFTERMTASHIFLTPWLREQRPFHMYLPVNVEVAEDWSDAEEEAEGSAADAIDEDEVGLCPLGEKHEYEDIGVEPLDYTRTTLQMAQNSNGLSTEREPDTDVEMG